MLLEEFDVDKYERSLKNEGIEIGLEQDRIADIKRSSEDFEYQQQLLKEFDILS